MTNSSNWGSLEPHAIKIDEANADVVITFSSLESRNTGPFKLLPLSLPPIPNPNQKAEDPI